MEVGNKVLVKDNLREELIKLSIDSVTRECMTERFVGTEQEILSLWKDKNGNEYATIGLWEFVPIQCLEVISK